MPISYTRRIDIGFFIAVVLICSLVSSVYMSFTRMNQQKARVEHTYQVIFTLQEIIGNLSDVQGSVRGYIITGREDYLAPYQIAMPKVSNALEKLAILVADNAEQRERSSSLQQHVVQRVSIAEAAIDTYRKDGQKKAMDSISSGSGKREMDEIRVIVADMVAEEKKLLDIRKTSVEDFTKLTLYAGASGAFLCLVILFTVFYLIHNELRARARTEASLRDAADLMERHNNETKLVSRMGYYLSSCREREEVYKVISEYLPQLFPQSWGCVSVYNDTRTTLLPTMTWGNLPEGMTMGFGPDDCWALRQGRGHLVIPENTTPVCEHLKNVDPHNVSFCLPMQAQGETVGQIYFGATVEGAKHVGRHEMGTMRRITEQISLALVNLDLQHALREQSIKDPLTKLFNRRYLEETMVREIARATRHQLPISILIMDIDFFKKVNDTYGHDGGDAVLQAFAKLLGIKIRKEDMACRLGGEEFVLVLPSASIDLAKARAQEICDNTRDLRIKHQNQIISITVSIGVAIFPDDGTAPEDLLQNADLALYRAKHQGRNQVVVFNPSLIQKTA